MLSSILMCCSFRQSALLLALGAVAFAGASWLAFDNRWALLVSSPGKVHSVHVAWEANCEACHNRFERSTGVGGDPSPGDKLCKNCHAGPDHHSATKAPGDVTSASFLVPHCAGCHHDHDTRVPSPLYCLTQRVLGV